MKRPSNGWIVGTGGGIAIGIMSRVLAIPNSYVVAFVLGIITGGIIVLITWHDHDQKQKNKEEKQRTLERSD